MVYLLDADVFIQAKNLHYGLDFCPAFWDWLIQQNSAGKVFSTEEVRKELEDGKDALVQWSRARGPDFFLKHDDDAAIVPAAIAVSKWATSRQFSRSAEYTFLNDTADYHIIAHALAHRCTVVTHEKPGNTKNKIKIPDACDGLGVHHTTPFKMLATEQARFILGL